MRKLILAALLASSAAPALASVPPPTISIKSDGPVVEGTPACATITKSAAARSYSRVSLVTRGGSALPGRDFTAVGPITLTFANAALTQHICTATIGNSIVDGTRNFIWAITAVRFAIIGTGEAQQAITDDDIAPAPTPVPTPTPAPTPAPIDPPGSFNNPLVGQSPGVGAPDIPTTDHDVMNDLIDAPLAPLNTGDVVGAFRFVCRHTSTKADDHVVYYQQPGKSHYHDETGPYAWGAGSNYGNLRVSGGGSGCNDVAGADGIGQPASATQNEINWAANRTPYEQPALLDGKGNIINANRTVYYYKRRPKTDPVVSDPTNPQYEGQAVPLPNGLKEVFGAFPGDSSRAPDTPVNYHCTTTGPNATDTVMSFAAAVQCAKAAPGNEFGARLDAPSCWDGHNLDSADHRSHVAYPSYGDWGYLKCDAAHPFVIPTFTYAVWYTILPTDDGDIHFSSDEGDNSKPRGWSFHNDYGPASWDPIVLAMWTAYCIDQMRNGNSGDLCNGKRLKGAGQPIYLVNGIYTSLWSNPQRLTPVPPMPAM